MAVKLSALTTESAPDSADIIGIADPTTGVMKKITVSALKTYMDTLGGGTAPTVSSATCPDGAANTVVVVFSQSMTAVTTAGWSFKKNGSAWSVSSVTGSGTTWTFTMGSSAVFGDTLLRSYDSTTGATIGTTLELVSFTDSAVTNSVAGGSLVEVNFDTKTAGLTESPANYWDSASGSTDYGVSSLTMAADGTFQAEVDGTGNAPIVVGTTSTNQYFLDGSYFLIDKASISVYGDKYYYAEQGAGQVDSGITSSTGHLYRIRRSGTSLIGEYSTNSGGSWSTIRSFTTTASGTIYLKTSIAISGDGVKNPQGTGIA